MSFKRAVRIGLMFFIGLVGACAMAAGGVLLATTSFLPPFGVRDPLTATLLYGGVPFLIFAVVFSVVELDPLRWRAKDG